MLTPIVLPPRVENENAPNGPGCVFVVLTQVLREITYAVQGLGAKIGKCISGQGGVTVLPDNVKSPPAGTKRILFVRHGQGLHNKSLAGWQLCDPPLTEVGRGQVAELNAKLQPYLHEVEVVIVSPLIRAMQTATGGLEGTKAPFMVNPMLRERLGAPCDTGLTKTELLAAFPSCKSWGGIDEMPEVWWADCIDADLHGRVEALKEYLMQRPEKVICVVGHGGFFSRIVGRHLPNCGFTWMRLGEPTPKRCDDYLRMTFATSKEETKSLL